MGEGGGEHGQEASKIKVNFVTYTVLEIGSCFSEADEAKIANCVPASSAAPNIVASIKAHQYPSW